MCTFALLIGCSRFETKSKSSEMLITPVGTSHKSTKVHQALHLQLHFQRFVFFSICRLNLASCGVKTLDTLPLLPVIKYLGLACNELDDLLGVVNVLRRHASTVESLDLAGNPLYVKKWQQMVVTQTNDDNNADNNTSTTTTTTAGTAELTIVDFGMPLDENLFDLEQYSIIILCRYLTSLKKLDDRLLARLMEQIEVTKQQRQDNNNNSNGNGNGNESNSIQQSKKRKQQHQ